MRMVINTTPTELMKVVTRSPSLTTKNYVEYEGIMFILHSKLSKELYKELYDEDKDKFYYRSIAAELDQLIHKWDTNWIKSRRQIIYTSVDCISCIHIILYDDKIDINIFQRSADLKKIKNDIGFICTYFLHKFPTTKMDIRYLISIPHEFTKVLL